jgi:hypothetical protein
VLSGIPLCGTGDGGVKPQGLITVCALLLLTGCSGSGAPSSKGGGKASASSDGDGAKEVGVNTTLRQPDNPAEREGVKVYRPKRLTNTTYDQNKRMVVDLDTGDKLVITSPGHAGGPGQFGFLNEKTGGIAGGEYVFWSGKDVYVYNVTRMLTTKDGFRNYRAREEYGIGRLAEMFRARAEESYRKAQPLSKTGFRDTVLVVDSRPEKTSEINPVNGLRKTEQ